MNITFDLGNNSWKFHDDTMMGTWWKRCDGRTDRQTDRRTDGLNHRQSIDLFLIIYGKNFFVYVTLPPRHQCQLSIIRFVPKYLDQTLVNFSASLAGDWQTGCLWWEVVESRFHVDLKSNFALKNNSMECLLGRITRRMNVLYESWMKWTWHHSKLAVEEVSFFGGLESGTPSTIIFTR